MHAAREICIELNKLAAENIGESRNDQFGNEKTQQTCQEQAVLCVVSFEDAVQLAVAVLQAVAFDHSMQYY